MTDPNRALFESAVRLLEPVLGGMVFVGGCTAGLFMTDPAAGGVRPTIDVDAIANATSYSQYAALAERLRGLGLAEDPSEGAPVCRWRRGALVIDVMPIHAATLGFGSRWYPLAIETAETRRIAEHDVRIVAPALFVATKLEAFHGRGGGDFSASHDLEDIVAPADGRPELAADVAASRNEVRAYISSEMRILLGDPDFLEALPGFLLPDAASRARRPILEDRLRALVRTGPVGS